MVIRSDDESRTHGAVPAPGDGPKLQLDELLIQLIDRAQDVVSTQGRLRGLLRANQAVVGNLSLPVLLREIVAAACELARARYGALGVIDTGDGLEAFIHVGFDVETVARIGHLPAGKGLLGALIHEPYPIRLTTMSDDPRSAGFPAGHPPMTSFLGVPIRVRDVVFGNLYLTEREDGDFTAEDEELVSALAATAGVAIANARLYEEARRRQEWLQASAEVSQQLLSHEGEDPLELIASRARAIASADVVTLVLPSEDPARLRVEVASGEDAAELIALTYPLGNTLISSAIDSGRPLLVADATTDRRGTAQLDRVSRFGPMMILPLGRAGHTRGALVIARGHGGRPFTDADLEMSTTFADHAAVALELAAARADQQRMLLLEDRDRIARDLHDHVIQRMFAIGLSVQSVAAGLDDDDKTARLNRAVDNIDETIRQTRTSIFQLRGPLGPETGTVRTRLLAVAAEIRPVLGFDPQLRFDGPIDAVVPEPIVDDLVAVLREALTNVARHAHAERAEVDVRATSTELTLIVADDGVGISDSRRRSGLANLRQRAERHGGSLSLGRGAENHSDRLKEGTRLQWTIPLR